MYLIGNGRLGELARWHSTTVKILGAVEFIFGVLLLVPAAAALLYGEDPSAFLMPVPFLLVLGVLQYLLFRESFHFRNVDCLALIAEVWGLIFIISALPYFIQGTSAVNSLFESVSGLTTTGMTVFTDIEALTKSMRIWRAMTQWVGGIAVILVFMYLLPLFGIGRSFFSNELSGSGTSNFSMNMRKAARSFIYVYALLSVLEFILLMILDVEPFTALCLMFTTISTGGMMPMNGDLSVFPESVRLLTMAFMFIGGVNFYLHFRAIYRRERRVYRSSSEFRTMVAWFLIISAVMFVFMEYEASDLLLDLNAEDQIDMYLTALFDTISLATTAGFTLGDYSIYPDACVVTMMFISIVGASSGSTSGGIKVLRMRFVAGFLANAFRKVLRPNVISSVKVDGQSVEDTDVMQAVSLALVFMASFFVASFVLMFLGIDLYTSFGLSVATLSNTGVVFSATGTMASMAGASIAVKIVCMFLMWAGRLEITVALVLFTPSFWKEVRLNHGRSGRA